MDGERQHHIRKRYAVRTKPPGRRTLRVVVWVATTFWWEYFVGHKEVPVTQLRKLMLEELQRRNYSQTTVNSYLKIVESFAKHFGRSPDQLGPEQIRTYQVYLLNERTLGVRTVGHCTAALRFFFCKTLKRAYPIDEVPYPKAPRRSQQ